MIKVEEPHNDIVKYVLPEIHACICARELSSVLLPKRASGPSSAWKLPNRIDNVDPIHFQKDVRKSKDDAFIATTMTMLPAGLFYDLVQSDEVKTAHDIEIEGADLIYLFLQVLD